MAASGVTEANSPTRADHRSRRQRLRRPILDALGAGLVFVMLTAVGASAPVKACPFSGAFSGIERPFPPHIAKAIAVAAPAPIVEIATTSSPWNPDAVYRRTSSTAAWGLLGLSLSLLTALNLSFFRHLRRVYVTPEGRRSPTK